MQPLDFDKLPKHEVLDIISKSSPKEIEDFCRNNKRFYQICKANAKKILAKKASNEKSNLSILSQGSSYVTYIGLIAVLINNFNNDEGNNIACSNDNIDLIRKLEKAILTVAIGQYTINFFIKDIHKQQRWRYLDWIITTPMLLKTVHLLAVEKGWQGSFLPAFGFDILMILTGYLAEFGSSGNRSGTLRNRKENPNKLWIVISFVSFGVILYIVTQWFHYLEEQNVDTSNLSKFFYIGWTFYGLNFFTPNEDLRQTGFNLADLFNKGIYSLTLNDLIKTSF